MDRFDAMRIFVAVADARGFAPAARQLGLSPPAVSRAIVALEEHVGAQLLRRTTRSVSLTDVGERFHADCKRILAEVADAEAGAGGAHAAAQGLLAITAPQMFGLSYQVAAHVQADRLRIVLADHEPAPIPVQVVYVDGRKAAAKVKAFVDFTVDRLRREPVLNGSFDWPAALRVA